MNEFLIVSTGRADFGLLRPLINRMIESKSMQVEIMLLGDHMNPDKGSFGQRVIKEFGDYVQHILNCYPGSGDTIDICKSISKGIVGVSEIFKEKSYSAIIVLGDRYELLEICIPSLLYKIPIVHLHGGETTEGAIDEAIRHSVTKMASIHFSSTETYRERIISMGESPNRVFNVGALSMDNIYNLDPIEKEELEKYLGISLDEEVVLMTYHPETLNGNLDGGNQVKEILDALISYEYNVVITMPNSDPGYDIISRAILEHSKGNERIRVFTSLGNRRYLSLLKYCKLMIGNSSSGLFESIPYGLPVINIGNRQKGRLQTDNVINTVCNKYEIIKAIDYIESREYVSKLENLKNPYGSGETAIEIVNILSQIDFLDRSLIQKEFYNKGR